MRITKAVKQEMLSILEERYQGTATALDYSSPFELLIAVVLSAQCTDVRVNIITKRLFPEYNTPTKIKEMGLEKLEAYIRDCGLYHSKARNIMATCDILCREYDEKVPETFEELITLPGVGRKTANVVLSQLFNIPAIAVDTHVFRVSNRLGLAKGDTPLTVEEGLMKAIPRNKWSDAHHWLIWHGRRICKARKPECNTCPLAALCPSKIL
ncbi:MULTISPECIES: endonuclease III [Pelosinus]|uniref:Endonuclease III n=2 Tax=Pelosinus fermentans TaxID=365349 RepID=I8U3Q4_9FIRM|nr:MULTISPECIES: endonuclease III [Pelosinus]AJQ28171.1 endonuclease III [Pelosinus fermentans JBW45]EIW17989.1 endonuclease III [Pelosinus fermentans B4]EIW23951.1 endonuclease III [Pelosinus fermentans A11]OAM94874.1 endonuclease III [Pelosinus fermentans DSM 17108]SDR19427.1 DNA-(apurinic or apyrimidinic site) lyase /endonuclease III [Pelosinus fermentans]